MSVALLPPPSLIEVCKAMATIATLINQQNIDDDDIYLGNIIRVVGVVEVEGEDEED